MTETIDVSVLRDIFAGLDAARAYHGSNYSEIDSMRERAKMHPEPEVKDWLLEQLDYLEQQIFPERFEEDDHVCPIN